MFHHTGRTYSTVHHVVWKIAQIKTAVSVQYTNCLRFGIWLYHETSTLFLQCKANQVSFLRKANLDFAMGKFLDLNYISVL